MYTANTPVTAAAVRMKSGSTEDESYAADIVNHRWLMRQVNLMSQSSHMNVDEVGLGDEFVIPDILQQHGACHHLVFAAHHIFEEPELSWQELDYTIPPLCGSFDEIELERTDLEGCGPAVCRPAQQGLDPGDQFHGRERFCEIIITTRPQTAHAIVDGAKCAQDKNGRAHALVSQCLDNGQAVHSGQQAIDNHGVRIPCAGPVQACEAVSSPVHLEPVIAEFGSDFLSRLFVIFDEKQPSHQPVLIRHDRTLAANISAGGPIGHARICKNVGRIAQLRWSPAALSARQPQHQPDSHCQSSSQTRHQSPKTQGCKHTVVGLGRRTPRRPVSEVVKAWPSAVAPICLGFRKLYSLCLTASVPVGKTTLVSPQGSPRGYAKNQTINGQGGEAQVWMSGAMPIALP